MDQNVEKYEKQHVYSVISLFERRFVMQNLQCFCFTICSCITLLLSVLSSRSVLSSSSLSVTTCIQIY